MDSPSQINRDIYNISYLVLLIEIVDNNKQSDPRCPNIVSSSPYANLLSVSSSGYLSTTLMMSRQTSPTHRIFFCSSILNYALWTLTQDLLSQRKFKNQDFLSATFQSKSLACSLLTTKAKKKNNNAIV